MAAAEPASFPQFSRLPPELRLSIWEAAVSAPSMHLFDVCLPPTVMPSEGGRPHARSRAQIAFGRDEIGDSSINTPPDEASSRYETFKNTIFFDAHRSSCSSSSSRDDRQAQLDPSMYKWKMALASACVDASAATSLLPKAVLDGDINTVYLPGPDRRIQYDNRADVLHLYFSPQRDPAPSITADAAPTPTAAPAPDRGCALKLSRGPKYLISYDGAGGDDDDDGTETGPGLLDVPWSNEMAETLRAARRVALDAAEITCLIDMDGPLAAEEFAMLACTLYRGLEVLYFVDYCPGRCRDCARPGLRGRDLTRRGALFRQINGLDYDEGDDSSTSDKDDNNDNNDADRPPDVIWGVGRVYREVFDLERLGWSLAHPAYNFAWALADAVREQQVYSTGACQLKGVRVLVAEDE